MALGGPDIGAGARTHEVLSVADEKRQKIVGTIDGLLHRIDRVRQKQQYFSIDNSELKKIIDGLFEGRQQLAELKETLPGASIAHLGEAERYLETDPVMVRTREHLPQAEVQIDKALFPSATEKVSNLVATYIKERKLLRRRLLSETIGSEEIIRAAQKEGINLDEVFRVAACEEAAYRLTETLRSETAELLTYDKEKMEDVRGKNAKRVNNWFLVSILGNVGTFASMVALEKSGLRQGLDAQMYQIVHSVAGALASGVTGYFSNRWLMKGELQTGYATLDILDKGKERLPATVPPNLPYAELFRQYRELLEQHKISEHVNDACLLLEEIARRKAQEEVAMAIETVPKTVHEDQGTLLAKRLIRLKEIEWSGSEREKNKGLQEVVAARIKAARRKATNTQAWHNALDWGAIGGLFSYLNPTIPWSPTAATSPLRAFMFISARARYARKHSWEWLSRYEQKRHLQERVARGEVEVAELLTPPETRTLAIDERMFLLDRQITDETEGSVRDKLHSIQRLDVDRKQILENEREALKALLPAVHGYFFFNQDKGGQIHAYRLWPLQTEKGNAYSRPDPSNWPDLQEEPVLQHVAGLRSGEFVVKEYDPRSLYYFNKTAHRLEHYPEMDEEEFQLSWNLPDDIWTLKEKGDQLLDYQSVFPVREGDRLAQVFIRPDMVGSAAYALISENVSLKALLEQLRTRPESV